MTGSIGKIYRSGLLSPVGLYRLAGSFLRSGVNLMALMRYTATRYPCRTAITDDDGSITYAELYSRTQQLANTLKVGYGLAPGRRVAIVCRNHAALVSTIFAASATGADIYMLSPEMSATQLASICERHHFHLLIHDGDIAQKLPLVYKGACLAAHGMDGESVESLCMRPGAVARRYARAGNLVVLTGGTTGEHKTAPRKQGVARFVRPLLALIAQADLGNRQTVLMATPICHGFGLAGLFVAVLLGTEMCMMQRFDAVRACALTKERKADAAVLVPIMLQRMLAQDVKALRTLKTILSGGAQIHEALVADTLTRLGPVLFNLYGTSEAGFSLMATPQDLERYPGSIGRPIRGVELRIADAGGNSMPPGVTGQLYLRNGWAINSAADRWIATGDVAYQNEEGYCFLQGRTDDMIVSGGVNVYPVVVENALMQHPLVAECVAIGQADDEFGERLVAFVVLRDAVSADELKLWLRDKIARYEMPREIRLIRRLPYTAIGKPDRKRLAWEY